MPKLAGVSGKITCTPNNTEKFATFSLGQFKFLDSFQFMPSSLEKLVKATGKDKFKITRKAFDVDEPFTKITPSSEFKTENNRNITLIEEIDKSKLMHII